MKQYVINGAYDTLVGMSSLKLPVKVSYDLWRIVKKLEEPHAFYEQQRIKFVEEHHGVINNGYVTFSSKDDENAFINDINELLNMEIDFDIQPAKVPLSTFGNQTIAVSDIARLDGFVEFVD